MAKVNRFSQVAQPARFSPLTFEELSFAPITLREREDALMDERDTLLQELAEYESPEKFKPFIDQRKAALESSINDLASRIQEEGVNNMSLVNEFRNVRNAYKKEVSATGPIGLAAGMQEHFNNVRALYMEDAVLLHNTQKSTYSGILA